MKEKDIIKALFRFTDEKGHKYMCSNTQCIPGVGEADFLSVNKNLFITEYEIKTSRSDFKADFRNKVNKHKKMSKEFIKLTKWTSKGYVELNEIIAPFVNYFFFVVPEGLISIDEVPSYAGLIYVKEVSIFNKEKLICIQIKNPKRFHSDKIPNKTLLDMYRSVMYKYYNK